MKLYVSARAWRARCPMITILATSATSLMLSSVRTPWVSQINMPARITRIHVGALAKDEVETCSTSDSADLNQPSMTDPILMFSPWRTRTRLRMSRKRQANSPARSSTTSRCQPPCTESPVPPPGVDVIRGEVEGEACANGVFGDDGVEGNGVVENPEGRDTN